MNTQLKILIVDDSEFMRKVLIGILDGAGFKNFVEAENGQEALKHIEAGAPDLVLLDLVMPEMTGQEVLKKIGNTVNVIVVSAVGQESSIAEAKSMGAKGYIVKPFDRKQVIDEITRVMP